MKNAALTLGMILAMSSNYAIGHGGGLNADGCHNERKTGGYHCHRAPAVLATSPKTPLPLAAQPLPQLQPTCHVGPRGGTYTITSSGRKNYSGC